MKKEIFFKYFVVYLIFPILLMSCKLSNIITKSPANEEKFTDNQNAFEQFSTEFPIFDSTETEKIGVDFQPIKINSSRRFQGSEAISPQNINELERLGPLGFGKVLKVRWLSNGTQFSIGSTGGFYIYSYPDLKIIQFMEIYPEGTRPVDISQDGKYYAIPSDTTINLYDTEKSMLISKFENDGWPTFSPNGELLALPDGGGVTLWDIKKGKIICYLPFNQPLTWAFSFDSRKLLISGEDIFTFIYDINTGSLLNQVNKNAEKDLIVSPNQEYFVVVNSKVATLVDFKTGVSIREFEMDNLDTNKNYLATAEFSPDNSKLAVASSQGDIGVWDVETGLEIISLEKARYMTNDVTNDYDKFVLSSLSFSPDGEKLLFGGQDGATRIWDISTDTEVLSILDHISYMESMSYSPKGNFLATGFHDGFVRIWDLHEERVKNILFSEFREKIDSVAFSPDDKIIASGSIGHVDLWDTLSGKLINKSVSVRQAIDLEFSPDGKILAVNDSWNSIKLFDIETAEIIGEIEGDDIFEAAYSSVFTKDGEKIIVGFSTGKIIVWDILTSSIDEIIRTEGEHINFLEYLNNDQLVSLQIEDNKVKIIDFETGITSRMIETPESGVAFDISPDGKMIVGVLTNEMVFWDTATGLELHRVEIPTKDYYSSASVAFSPSGDTIILSQAWELIWFYGIP